MSLEKIKARLRLQGNKDSEKGQIQSDHSFVQRYIIYMLLSLATHFKFCLGYINVKAVSLQSGRTTRKVFVKASNEYNNWR